MALYQDEPWFSELDDLFAASIRELALPEIVAAVTMLAEARQRYAASLARALADPRLTEIACNGYVAKSRRREATTITLMAVCTENLNPKVMVMKSAKDRIWRDRSDPLNRAKGGRIFIQ